MLRQHPDQPIFIYQKMEPKTAQAMLRDRLTQLAMTDPVKYQALVESGKAWIVRESRVPGMLTIHSYALKKQTDDATGKMTIELVDELPQRICLCHNGWAFNNHTPGTNEFNEILENNGGLQQNLSRDNASQYLSSFYETIAQNQFPEASRINPLQGEQTKTNTYSGYHVANDLPESSVEIELPLEISQLFCCPLSRKQLKHFMQEPVILATPVHDTQHLLVVGKTYEKENLLMYSRRLHIRLTEGVNYYPNTTLKKIIRYLSTIYLKNHERITDETRLDKLEKIHTEITCPILLEQMTNPVVTAAGTSYDEESINTFIETKTRSAALFATIKDPITNVEITGCAVVKNENLARFIAHWPKLYESEKENLTLAVPKISTSG